MYMQIKGLQRSVGDRYANKRLKSHRLPRVVRPGAANRGACGTHASKPGRTPSPLVFSISYLDLFSAPLRPEASGLR
jgi:hypothetical protein